MAVVIGVLAMAVGTVAGGWYKFEEDARRVKEEARRQKETALAEARDKDGQQQLDRLLEALKADRLDVAREALAAVKNRLADGGSDELRQWLRIAERDVAFLIARERVRQAPDKEQYVTEEYRRAFQTYGIDLNERAAAVKIIRSSAIRAQLLAALDDWALKAGVWESRKPLLVAQAASDSPWEQRFRNPDFRNLAGLNLLVQDTRPHQLTAGEIESLAKTLLNFSIDAEPLLRDGLSSYPDDYWLSLLFAETIARKARTVRQTESRRQMLTEAVGHVRVTLPFGPRALRPA